MPAGSGCSGLQLRPSARHSRDTVERAALRLTCRRTMNHARHFYNTARVKHLVSPVLACVNIHSPHCGLSRRGQCAHRVAVRMATSRHQDCPSPVYVVRISGVRRIRTSSSVPENPGLVDLPMNSDHTGDEIPTACHPCGYCSSRTREPDCSGGQIRPWIWAPGDRSAQTHSTGNRRTPRHPSDILPGRRQGTGCLVGGTGSLSAPQIAPRE